MANATCTASRRNSSGYLEAYPQTTPSSGVRRNWVSTKRGQDQTPKPRSRPATTPTGWPRLREPDRVPIHNRCGPDRTAYRRRVRSRVAAEGVGAISRPYDLIPTVASVTPCHTFGPRDTYGRLLGFEMGDFEPSHAAQPRIPGPACPEEARLVVRQTDPGPTLCRYQSANASPIWSGESSWRK